MPEPIDLDATEFAAILDAPIRFWRCPVRGHSDRTRSDGRPLVTVEWVDGVAECTIPGCHRTSTDPVPRGYCSCEEYGCVGDCCGLGNCLCSEPIDA
jgi:hypothetical protein